MTLANRALVVGINHYPAIGMLKGAHADAMDFYDWVVDPAGGGVDGAMAKLILSGPGASLAVKDAQPARYQIESFFNEVDECANENNAAGLGLKAGKRLYMFFSGHGFAPSFDRSAVLMANTTLTLMDNLGARLWADRLFQGGWFDEVLLFQDACRSPIGAGDPMVPYLKLRNNPGKSRFYAFAAKDGKIALEKLNNGNVRGVFTLTLMEGLRGQARDPQTGDITGAQLRAYLQANMKAKLSPAEMQDDEVAKVPDVFDPDPCVIVKAPAVAPAVRAFPVRIALPAANLTARVQDWTFTVVAQNAGVRDWSLALPIGFYKVLIDGRDEQMFEVNGSAGVVDVRIG